jgi:protein ImuB
MPADAVGVTVARRSNTVVVAAATPAAVRLGAEPGQRLADLRARIPDIAVFEADPAADARLLGALADGCERYTPLVAEDTDRHAAARLVGDRAPGGRVGGSRVPGRPARRSPGASDGWPEVGLLLDMTGALHLFGGETAFLAEITRRLAGQGIHSRVGLATHPGLARAVAAHGAGGFVPPGAERETVAALPVRALTSAYVTGDGAADADRLAGLADAVDGLRLAGLRTIGAVLAQPRAGLAARFGKDVVAALDRLTAVDDEPISPRRPVADLIAERLFFEPITAEPVVEATLADLAAEIARRLAETGEGADRFEARFYRVDGAVRAVAVRVSPTRDAALLHRLFRHRLAALASPLDAGFGFDMIRLEAFGRARLEPEALSLDGREAAGHDLARLVDRLAARFGADAVTRPVFHDSHVPERAAGWCPAQDLPPAGAPRPAGFGPVRPEGEPPVRPFRLVEPPDRVEVMAEIPDGPPLRFRWRRVLHEVVRAEGPERVAAEWWLDPCGPTRDYFRVEDRAGRRFWLFRLGLYERETPTPVWYMHGLFA